jgi:hypothetical protein
VKPGEPDPRCSEFQYIVVPRVKQFIFTYSGFSGLRWLLGNTISGLKFHFRATHLAVTSLFDGTDQRYREQVAVLDVMKVGPTAKCQAVSVAVTW